VIYLIKEKVTKSQIQEMLEPLETYIKVAVDIERGILAGGGTLHADCEAVLLEDGGRQEDIWGADWIPETQEIRYEALMNIRPRQNNPDMKILDSAVRERVAEIASRLLRIE